MLGVAGTGGLPHGLLKMADVVRTLRNAVHPWEARKSRDGIEPFHRACRRRLRTK